MDIKELLKNMSAEDKASIAKEVIKETVGKIITPPAKDVPYLNVMFCNLQEGWTAFFGYGADIDPQTTVKFIQRIGDATDVLNGKEE
jgi:hypothetical protein